MNIEMTKICQMKKNKNPRMGIECFGNIESFNDWLEKPAYGLGFKIPKSLMETQEGVLLVEDELIRIAYGALA